MGEGGGTSDNALDWLIKEFAVNIVYPRPGGNLAYLGLFQADGKYYESKFQTKKEVDGLESGKIIEVGFYNPARVRENGRNYVFDNIEINCKQVMSTKILPAREEEHVNLIRVCSHPVNGSKDWMSLCWIASEKEMRQAMTPLGNKYVAVISVK